VSCAWLAAPTATTTISVAGPGDAATWHASPVPGLLAPTRTGLTPAGDDEFVVDQLLSQDVQL